MDVSEPVRDPPAGWVSPGPTRQIRRVHADIVWTDGRTTRHRTIAYQWTRDRVLVSVPASEHHPGRVQMHMVWIPAAQVRANTDPPLPGETVPVPEYGCTAVIVWPPGGRQAADH